MPDPHADILLLDVYLDDGHELKKMDGFEVVARVKQTHPAMHVLAHSSYDDVVRVQRMLDAGASGFVSKRSSYDELRRGISMLKRRHIHLL